MKTTILIILALLTTSVYASEIDYRAKIEGAIRQYGEEANATKRAQIGEMLEWLSRRNETNRNELPDENVLAIGKKLELAANEKFYPEVLCLTSQLERFAIGNPPLFFIYYLNK
jgi:hypothetical protein